MHLRFKKWATGVVFFLLLVVTSGTGLFAQVLQASLSGQITDSTGAAVTGAKITVRNIETGTTTIGVSGSQGYYRVGSLSAGQYTITVEKPGFSTGVREGIILLAAQQATVGLELAPGNISQRVVVTGQAAQLQTETSNQGETIDQERMLTLPTMGQNPIAGVFSVPGVLVTASDQRLRGFDILGTSSTSINGGPPRANEIMVDGMSSIFEANSATYVPNVEATSEVRVQTTQFDAQNGWTLGGVINFVTKSGTNQFHGAVWEFFQNTVLDANNFNGNYTGTPRTSSHINIYGLNVGGPILKNKLFFDYSYEDLRQVIPDPFVVSVPTPLQKSGDFSQTYYATGKLQTIYNPFSTVNVGGTLQRTPFPGNVIPPALLNPVAVKVLSFIPNGNVAGNSVTGLNNFANNGSSRKFTDYFPENTIRVDVNVNPSTRFFVRYSRNALQEERGFQYSTNSALNPADVSNNAPFTRENHNATGQLTKVLSPTTVLNMRLGLERFKTANGAPYAIGTGPGALNFSPTFAAQASNQFPQFLWADYAGAGGTPPAFQTGYNYTAAASLEKSMGPYNLDVGVDLRLLRVNIQSPGNSNGHFTFDQQFTGANPLAISPSSGNAIASFLMGTPQSGYIDVNSEPARQEKMVSLYMQNDFRLSRKLTMNLGLRWDYLGPMTDRFNALATFDPSAPNPLQVPGQQLYGGLVFAGVNGQRRGITKQIWGNFGPRFGISYQLDNNTVLHGGYGLVYGQAWNDPGEAPGFSQRTNMVTSIQAGVPYNTLTNPFPTGILKPAGASQGLETNLGQSISFADPNGEPPDVQQFSVSIQHQLPKNFLVSAAYVGTRFSRLPVTQQINAVPLSAVGLGASALTQSVPNPFAGLLPGTALNGPTVQRQQLLAPYPQFLVGAITGQSGIQELFRPIGTSSYNAGQFLVSKRMSQGLDFTVQYTVSKQLDQTIFANAQDTQLEKVITATDIPRNMQINFLWQLPFGTGRPYGANLPRPVRGVISGWDVSSLVRLQAGMPLDLTNSPNSVPIGNPALSNPGLSRWFNTCTLLPNGTTQNCINGEQPVWTVRQPYTLQTWKTRLTSVRKPGVHNADISVLKNIPVTERVKMIFRADFINAFNSPQFYNGPISDVNNPNFGRIAGAMDQSNLPRFVQFSLKVQF